MATNPRIVIATQAIEGNLSVQRLLRACAGFGGVAVITPQTGPEQMDDVSFQRIISRREWFWRGLRVIARKAGVLLPRRLHAKWVEGFTEELPGLYHQSTNFRRAWQRHALKPELLVLHGAEYTATAVEVARNAGAGLVYCVHEMFPNQRAHYSPKLTACYCKYEKRTCEAASQIVVQHHLWGKLLRRRYGIEASKFTEVTPSPEPQDPLPGSPPDEPLRLYYHGLFTNGRGLEEMIQAVGLVPGVQFDLRGSGHYEPDLRRMAEETGAPERFRFLPPLPMAELPASGRAYDLGVMTATSEHLNGRMAAGMKLYENIAAGIPLFGFGAITVRNTIRNYRIGFSYDSNTPEAIADKLRWLVANRGEVNRARLATREAARTCFNSAHQYERLRAVIAKALEQRKSQVTP